MKIYTRSGDGGSTALFGGGRVPKDDARVDAYGSVDELNAVIGWCVACTSDVHLQGRLETIQHDLFALGAELATPPPRDGRRRPDTPGLPRQRIAEMEGWMDDADTELPELRAFVLPGGTQAAAALHMARTVCRRAERTVVHLAGQEAVDADVITYLNRLSDLLFTFARLSNAREGQGDVVWQKPRAS